MLARAGWDVERRRLIGAPPVQIEGSREIHASVYRALAVLGLGRDQVTHVDVDAQGRLRPDALPTLRAPAIIGAQAGNVSTGAFDPIAALCAAAAEVGAWGHVDGAFGLWAAAAPSTRRLVPGLEAVDSWATDLERRRAQPSARVVHDRRRPGRSFSAMLRVWSETVL